MRAMEGTRWMGVVAEKEEAFEAVEKGEGWLAPLRPSRDSSIL